MEEANEGKKELTTEKLNTIAQWLLQHSNDGKLQWGAKKAAAAEFGMCLKSIWHIWNRAGAQLEEGLPVNLRSKKIGSVRKNTKEFDKEKVKALSVLQRTSLRLIAANMGVSKSQAHLWYKQDKLKAHTNAIKPFLTPENKLCRLNWSLSQLGNIIADGKIKFNRMQNTVHVDEKWFYLTKTKDRYYLCKNEKPPERQCKSKRHINKIMFTAVVARPIIDENGTIIFDGKIGIFPFITEEPAMRNQHIYALNHIKASAMTVCIICIMKDQVVVSVVHKSAYICIESHKGIINDCLHHLHHERSSSSIYISFINIYMHSIMQLVPAIKDKWPECLGKHIYIQQDNAKPHILDSDPEFQAIANSDGFHFQLINQPANSPDTNINDLGFFRSIQTLKDQKPAANVDEMITNVKEAFDNYPPEKINKIFLTLQACYGEFMKVQGGNNYNIPHMGKDHLIREGKYPDCFEVDKQVVRDSLEYLNLHGNAEDKWYNLDDITESLDAVVLED